MFYSKIKKLRIQNRLSLRTFCKKLEIDPYYWSKIEVGVNNPPDYDILNKIVNLLNLNENETKELFYLARKDINYNLDEKKLLNMLPAFINITNDCDKLIKEIIKLHTKDN